MLGSGLQLYLKRDASAGVFLWTYLHFKYDIRYFVVYYDFISIWLRLSCVVGLNVDIYSIAADEPLCVCVFFLLFFIYFVLDSALYFRRLTLSWNFHVRGVFDVRCHLIDSCWLLYQLWWILLVYWNLPKACNFIKKEAPAQVFSC